MKKLNEYWPLILVLFAAGGVYAQVFSNASRIEKVENEQKAQVQDKIDLAVLKTKVDFIYKRMGGPELPDNEESE